MTQAFHRITLVSVTGLPDARGAAMALQHSQAQMPGSQAVLCSPAAPDDLASGIRHVPIAPMNYHEYSWFMMFALWRVVPTEFALVVQEDGWVVNASNWQENFLNCDYIGAPIHLARVVTPLTTYWSNKFEWSLLGDQPGLVITPVQNGGFSLRSQRFMRALIDHPHIRVEVPPPDTVEGEPGEPLHMRWQHNALLEDVQLSGILRPALEAVGMRYAPIELARIFSIEHAGPSLHHGWDARQLFGHHARMRRLVSLSPLTMRWEIPASQLNQWYGEPEVALMFERLGYQIEFAAEAANAVAPRPVVRKVYDCFTYNGEADILAIRLHELADVVDWFVIVEADRTFDGQPKALTLDIDDPRFAPFRQRLRYIAVHDMPDTAETGLTDTAIAGDWHSATPQTGHWAREKFQRNQVLRGVTDALPDDLIMVSDVDEIPRAHLVAYMRDALTIDSFGLCLAFYYFYANYRNVEGPEAASVWTVAATKRRLDATTPDRLRIEVRNGGHPAQLIPDAGWHLSYLGMSDDAVRHKIATFAHQEYNTPEVLATVNIDALTRSGRDLYGRPGYVWQVVSPGDAPLWMASQADFKPLFLPAPPSESMTARYKKESYLVYEPSPHGFWERHANRYILSGYATVIRGHVLDLGCNHGASTYWLTENPAVTSITGIDLNDDALDFARKLFAPLAIPHSFLCQDVTNGDFPMESVDTIVSFHTLEHLYAEDTPAFLQAAFNALAMGGHFVISIPYERAYLDPCHVSFYNEKSLVSVMRQAGFTMVECFEDNRFAEKNLLTGLFKKAASTSNPS